MPKNEFITSGSKIDNRLNDPETTVAVTTIIEKTNLCKNAGVALLRRI